MKKVITVLIVIIIASVTVMRSLENIEPAFNKICINKARSISIQIFNKKVADIMEKYAYEDLATIIKDIDGNVTMVKANIISINKIISEVAIEIQSEMDKLSAESVGIRLGSFTGNSFLSGRGPLVKFRITEKGDISTEYKSEFTHAGVNQTLHRIYLEVKCNLVILTPFSDVEEQIINQIILAENVIVGTTPETYYNFDNLTNADAVLESMQ